MGPIGLSIGFFSPGQQLGDVAKVCDRIREICGPSGEAFPLVLSPVRDEKEKSVVSYGVIRGHVPIHIDRPNPAERCSTIFTFVLETENRPVLLFSPAGRPEAQCIFTPDEVEVPRMAFGAVELGAGKAFHFDVARSFHGITGFPTGDLVPGLPEAVIVQVPWPDKSDIAGAVNLMMRVMWRDERFADLREGESA